MYGSVFRFRPRPGQEKALVGLMEQWNRERRPKLPGFVAGYMYRSESRPGEYVNAVVFKDRQAYMANADDPDQDRWYLQLRDLLEADPEWEDGEVVYAL